MLEKTLESPLDCKEIQLDHPKGNQSWIFIGSTDAEAETPILWPSDEKNWLIWKDPDDGKDWRLEEKGTTEDEVIEWHYQLDGPWVWVNSRSWWWTVRPGVWQSMGSQIVGHDWATELNWCIGRCTNLGSLQSLLGYALQLSRASFLFSHPKLPFLRVHLKSGCSLMAC